MTTVTHAPYDKNGNLLHWVKPGAKDLYGEPVEWRPNEPFTAVLELDRTESGRSAKYLMLTDQDGRSYPMFVTDMVDLLNRSEHGVRAGRTGEEQWVISKRGQNFGVKLAGPAAPRRRS